MKQIYATLVRDNQPLAQHLVVTLERESETETVTYSEGPHYRYHATLQFALPSGLQLQQNDYFKDEVNTDYISQTNVMYQVINEPDVWPNGYTEFKVDKVRLPQ